MTVDNIFFALAILFLLIELVTQKNVALRFAMAAALAGIIHWLYPAVDLRDLSLLFAITAIVFYLCLRRAALNNRIPTVRPKTLINKTFPLTRAIKKGRGKLVLDRAVWIVESDEDLPRNTQVQVTGVNGVILQVKQAVKEEIAGDPVRKS